MNVLKTKKQIEEEKIPALAIDNHPDLVTNPAIALNPARSVLTHLWDQWERLRSAEVVATDKRRLAHAAQGVVKSIDDRAVEALRMMDSFRKDIEAKLTSEITPARVDAAAAEIRAHWKGQRHPFTGLSSLVRAKDRRTMAAVLSAPAYLSGLTDEQHQTLLGLARESWFPEETKTLADIERHGQRVLIAQGTVKSTLEPRIKRWLGEEEEKAFARIEKKEEV